MVTLTGHILSSCERAYVSLCVCEVTPDDRELKMPYVCVCVCVSLLFSEAWK